MQLSTRYLSVVGMGLLLAACGGSSYNSSSTGGSGANGTITADSANPGAGAGTAVSLQDYLIKPASLTVKSGKSVFAVSNDGKAPHSFAIRSADGKILATTPNLDPGKKADLNADLPAGTYSYYCTLPGHESLGMLGTLTVQ